MVAQWYDLRLETQEDRVRILPGFGGKLKQRSRDYPIDVPATPSLPGT